jgi:polysaccharide export outer membrane protein
MNNQNKPRVKIFFLLLISSIVILISSCTEYKKIVYLNDIPDSLNYGSQKLAKYEDPKIQLDDIMSITILTIDPNTNAIINQGQLVPQGVLPGSLPSLSQAMNGYLVDKNGEVLIPLVGTIKIAGLTTSEARDLIKEKTAEFYKDPTVQVRFANFKVTVLGEVSRPGTYILPNEKNSILDAIGLAGDLTIYGKREDVLLMRDTLDHKIYVRMNLSNTKYIQSHYFYLRQNDVIYVEPNKSKVIAADAQATRYATIGAAVLTAIALILIRIK